MTSAVGGKDLKANPRIKSTEIETRVHHCDGLLWKQKWLAQQSRATHVIDHYMVRLNSYKLCIHLFFIIFREKKTIIAMIQLGDKSAYT